MEKIPPQAVPVLRPHLYPQQYLDLTRFTAIEGLKAVGGDA
jgi:hypothetical protein